MKKMLSLIILTITTFTAIAQKSTSTIRFRMTDGSPIVISLNDRDFQKVGTSLVVSDLPRKRHSVKLYRFRPYADGQGGKAELAYTGNIKIDPGFNYEAILNVKTGTLRVTKVNRFEALPTINTSHHSNDTELVTSQNSSNNLLSNDGGFRPAPTLDNDAFALPEQREKDLPADVMQLKQKMAEAVKDGDKLILANEFIAGRRITTQEAVAIINWIGFDDNKLIFAQNAKRRITDMQNIKLLANELTFTSSKEKFLEGL